MVVWCIYTNTYTERLSCVLTDSSRRSELVCVVLVSHTNCQNKTKCPHHDNTFLTTSEANTVLDNWILGFDGKWQSLMLPCLNSTLIKHTQLKDRQSTV